MSIGSRLCTECGLCCAGALHDVAVLDDDEVAAASRQGFTVTVRTNPRFDLPCPHLQGTLCGIYDRRPKVCSRYRCRLLQDVDTGILPLDQALSKVREARRLLDKVREWLPPGMSVPQARALVETPATPDAGEAIAADHGLFLHTLALMYYIDLHFRHAKEGPLLVEQELITSGRSHDREEETPENV